MLRRLQAFFVLGVWVVANTAAAQELTEDPAPESGDEWTTVKEPTSESGDEPAASEDLRAELDALRAEVEALKQQNKEQASAVAEEATPPASTDEPASETRASTQASAEPVGAASDTKLKLSGLHTGWATGVTGYFRAPLTIGISKRPGPDDLDGPHRRQLAFGPNRIMDSNYYSFAYTRLQEQDWVELAFYARKKHVEAAVGWMGYWLQAAGYRNGDASWAPGIARLTLDTDFDLGSITPNIALTGGAWWPRFGYHAKYDTYTLGLFRQVGEQLCLTIPFNFGLTLTLYQGFGTGRDGKFNYTIGGAPMQYGAQTGLDLLHYEHIRLSYREYVSIGLHYNNQWTRDPNLYPQEFGEMTYEGVRKAGLQVGGGEVTLSAPRAGRLWVSPSYIGVRNGWALANAGTEVMHSMGGAGIAVNYMGYYTSVAESTGTGKMLNLGFLYDNTLSGILGKKRGSMFPDLTASVFGLMALANLDLPEGSEVQDQIRQFKWGVDAEVHIQKWVGLMARYDAVNYDLDHPGYIFSAITARLSFSSHFLSGEKIYLQYSRYIYGDKMTLTGRWPWNNASTLIAGSEYTQAEPAYTGWKPDMDVIKVQAEIAF